MESYLNKVAALEQQLSWNQNSIAGVFVWILTNFSEQLFSKTSADGCLYVGDSPELLIDIFFQIFIKTIYFRKFINDSNAMVLVIH